MSKKSKGIIILSILAIFGITTLAYAGWGMGYGQMMGPGSGSGWHHMGGYYRNLSPDEIARLDRQRAEFLEKTGNIRQHLYEKQLTLRAELARENPDTGRLSKLQNEISRLQNELDRTRMDFEIQAGNTSSGYGGNWGSGRRGPMMERGYGGGYCRW